MADQINLPSSSRGELEKIIKGYGHVGKEVDLETLSKLTAIGRTTISPNNPFLTQAGIIAGARKKQITDTGRKLSRALEHNLQEEISASWREVIRGSEFLSNIVSTIRIKGGMASDDVMRHILFASESKNTKANKTGAKTITDLLLLSGLIEENAGKLRVATTVPQSASAEPIDESQSTEVSLLIAQVETATPTPISTTHPVVNAGTTFGSPTIAINIQLQLPETDKPEVYEELFKALRRHLFPG
ncbi:hypothetical protein [Thiobaca trueperi]|uniref:DUF5343 domain-containing protein n=1 Tax=Thiobaca trueperi TaxID=127458 RepID=A0A4R3MYS8_9GAMM|nr:hypothetical protein [Thiobaca trueperi]TCT20801.1 hypothetical protein EDC35_105245 [Thiobaca trueperi]